MPRGAHQWPVNPKAIEVRPLVGVAICSELKCHLDAAYQVAFPRQAPSRYCPRHTRANIRRAIGRPPSLVKMLQGTEALDGMVRRTKRRHVHWPEGDRTDEQMAEVDNMTADFRVPASAS